MNFDTLFTVCRDVFGKGGEVVQRLAECSEEGLPLADVLAHLFYLPIKHLHEYGRVLLKLSSCYEMVSSFYHPHTNVFKGAVVEFLFCFAVRWQTVSPGLLLSYCFVSMTGFCGLSEAARLLLEIRVDGSSSKSEEEGGRIHAAILEEFSWEDDCELPCVSQLAQTSRANTLISVPVVGL